MKTTLPKDIDSFLDTLKIHNKDLDACFNDALAVRHLKELCKSELLQLITESKPDCNSIIQPDLSEVPENAYWVYFKGQKHAADKFEQNLLNKLEEK